MVDISPYSQAQSHPNLQKSAMNKPNISAKHVSLTLWHQMHLMYVILQAAVSIFRKWAVCSQNYHVFILLMTERFSFFFLLFENMFQRFSSFKKGHRMTWLSSGRSSAGPYFPLWINNICYICTSPVRVTMTYWDMPTSIIVTFHYQHLCYYLIFIVQDRLAWI